MANRQAGLTRTNIIVIIGALFLVTVTGCTEISMPDVSNLLNNTYEVVVIKESYDSVNVRPTPSTDYKPIASVRGGDKLNMYEEQGNWLYVTFYDTAGGKQEGWVYKYLVEGYEKPAKKPSASNHDDVYEPQEPASKKDPVKEEDFSVL